MHRRTAAEWQRVVRNIKAGYPPAEQRPRIFENGRHYVAEHIAPLGVLANPDALIVDVGCGNGRLAMGLTEYAVAYRGLDVVAEAIGFCRKAFEPWPAFQFTHLDVRNARYNPRGRIEPERARLPYEDGIATLVVASSLFTHIAAERAVDNYLAEMMRVLRPGGLMLTTWFRRPPNDPSVDEARAVHAERAIRRWLSPSAWVKDYGGESTRHHDQWMVVTRKP
jgi:SAM-dependent methyltransferase